jgi:hypothetical protein
MCRHANAIASVRPSSCPAVHGVRACIGFRAVESDGERGVCNWTALFLLLPFAILICSWLAAEVDLVERAHAAPAQALAAPVRYDVSHPTWSIPR